MAKGFVTGRWLDGELRRIVEMLAGPDIDGDHVVVQCDGADRCAKTEIKIASGPSFGIRIVGEVAVVADDVAINPLHAACHHRISELRDDFVRVPIAFDFLHERQLTIRQIRIATANQRQISAQPAVRIELPGSLDGGAESVIGAERCERKRAGEDFGVRGRSEKPVRIQFVKRLAGCRVSDKNSPISFARIRPGQRRRDARLESGDIRPLLLRGF